MGNGETIKFDTTDIVLIVEPWYLLMVFWNEMIGALICHMHFRSMLM